jgi:hypothetical protein
MKRSFFLTFVILISISTAHAQSRHFSGSVHGGFPFFRPHDDYELYKSSYMFGGELSYGGSLALGIAFEYFQFYEKEQALTDVTGPEIFEIFTPFLENKFYALSITYKFQHHARWTQFIKTNIGYVKRTMDLSIEQGKYKSYTYSDSYRLAWSVNAGAEFSISESFAVVPSVSYWLTSEYSDDDWNANFNVARSHLAVTIGIRYSFE